MAVRDDKIGFAAIVKAFQLQFSYMLCEYGFFGIVS